MGIVYILLDTSKLEMNLLQRATKNLRNFRDGRRIEDYCAGRSYSQSDVAALKEVHRLHSNETDLTAQEALEKLAQNSPSEKASFKEDLARILPRRADALFRLIEDEVYAKRIITAYHNDIRENVDL